MGNGIRVLIAVTCVTVIAAIGFWSWKALSDEAAAKTRAEQMAYRSMCLSLLDELKTDAAAHVLAEPLACIERKMMTVADIRAAGLSHIAKAVEDHIATYGSSAD